jgi:hypothetical protein
MLRVQVSTDDRFRRQGVMGAGRHEGPLFDSLRTLCADASLPGIGSIRSTAHSFDPARTAKIAIRPPVPDYLSDTFSELDGFASKARKSM